MPLADATFPWAPIAWKLELKFLEEEFKPEKLEPCLEEDEEGEELEYEEEEDEVEGEVEEVVPYLRWNLGEFL